jgi:hypothetical protein
MGFPMTDTIAPALTEMEWADGLYASADITLVRQRVGIAGNQRLDITIHSHPLDDPADFAALIAMNNAALPDDDRRKITWKTVERLQRKAIAGVSPRDDWMLELADALASYLPPRTSPKG